MRVPRRRQPRYIKVLAILEYSPSIPFLPWFENIHPAGGGVIPQTQTLSISSPFRYMAHAVFGDHRLRKGCHAAGDRWVLRSSCTKYRITIPTMYVVLSNVSAVANPALSMR